ncbi:hypothetical protein Pcinc_019554, partial [Petrolisthes cinctipes]
TSFSSYSVVLVLLLLPRKSKKALVRSEKGRKGIKKRFESGTVLAASAACTKTPTTPPTATPTSAATMSSHGLRGLVQVMSGMCWNEHKVGKNDYRTQEKFNQWQGIHISECSLNYEGSSGAMEETAAKQIWQRSTAKNPLVMEIAQ